MRYKTIVNKNHTLQGHRESIYALCLAHDTNYFYSAGSDGFLVKWETKGTKDGQLVARFPKTVYALALHPTKNWLYVGQNFEGIHLIDLDTNQELKSVRITEQAIFNITFFRDQIFVASGDGRIIILNAETFQVVNVVRCSEKSARSIAINPLKNEFAVGYSDKYIRIFDIENLHLKQEFKAHESSVFTLSYSPDSQFLFSGGKDAHLKIWDTENYQKYHAVIAHMYTINNLVFSPKGNFFATCSMDKSIKIWDTNTLKLLKVIDRGRYQGHQSSINQLLWVQDADKPIISCSDDRKIIIWDVQIYQSDR